MKSRYLIACLTLWGFTSCNLIADYTLGDMAERRVNLPTSFEKMDLKSSFHVTLFQDSVSFVLVKCPEKLLDDIDIKTQNNILSIRENVKSRWLKDYPIIEIELHLTELPMIEIRQPCRLTIPNTFKSQNFYLVDWGKYVDCTANVDVDLLVINVSYNNFGTYRIQGQAENATLHAHGAALMDLSQTKIKYCNAIQNSNATMAIWVTDSIKVDITSSGDVYLKGNPLVELNRQGTGTLINVR